MARADASKFLTLTIRHDPARTPRESLDLMNACWRSLWKRLKREHGRRARGYVKIVETTRQGTPHLHIAVDMPFTAQAVLSAAWEELSGSPIVDIRVIRTQNGIARYLSKYLTKAREAIAGRRRWSQSSHFLPAPPEQVAQPDEMPMTYSFTKRSAQDVEQGLQQAGYLFLVSAYVRIDLLDTA